MRTLARATQVYWDLPLTLLRMKSMALVDQLSYYDNFLALPECDCDPGLSLQLHKSTSLQDLVPRVLPMLDRFGGETPATNMPSERDLKRVLSTQVGKSRRATAERLVAQAGCSEILFRYSGMKHITDEFLKT